MLIINDISDPRVVSTLLDGGVVVLRTDTLYGIVACANNESAVERVYNIKDRNSQKSCIILLDKPESCYEHADELSVDMSTYNDAPTSFLIDADLAPGYLLRQNKQLAYRIPADKDLKTLLLKTGPLIAPSANPEGDTPAHTIQEAVNYFGNAVDIYVDGGTVPKDMPPSRIVRVHPDGRLERLR